MKAPTLVVSSLVTGVLTASLLPSALQAQELTNLNFVAANDTSCSIFEPHVARELGLNAANGVQVTMLSSATTVPYVAFLSNGDAEVVQLDAAQVLQMANAGEPGSVIYETDQFASEGVVVRADSPITTIADLKGKTIGLASDRDQVTVLITLDTIGMNISEVSTAVVGDSGPVLAKSLLDGTIDAFAGGSTDRLGIISAGVEIRDLTPAAVNHNPANSIAIWNSRIEELRVPVSAWLRGWAMAQHTGVMDTKVVMSICKKLIPEQWEDPVFGERLVRNSAYNFHLRRTKNYGELQPQVWESIQLALVRVGELDRVIAPTEFLDASFLDAANAWTTPELRAAIDAWKEANAEHVME